VYHPNDQIGPYTLVRRLGQGSFGIVWLARDSSSIVREHVALKLPIGEEIDTERMRQEAALWLKASGHPNVLPVIDARVYEDQIAIVSEYLPDGTLGQRLDQHHGKAPSQAWAVNVTIGILKGLEHLHSLKMVHRDLKPNNVMLDGDVPRLTDFGLTRILRSSARNRPSDGAGTLPYTAPEVFRGGLSEQSDIWAVGVILYQMLAGVLPFPQEHQAEVMYAICNSAVPPLPDSVSENLRQIVTRALDKDLGRRLPTARAMRDALAPHPSSDLLNKSMLVFPAVESTLHISKAPGDLSPASRALFAQSSASPPTSAEYAPAADASSKIPHNPPQTKDSEQDHNRSRRTESPARLSVQARAIVIGVLALAASGGGGYLLYRSLHPIQLAASSVIGSASLPAAGTVAVPPPPETATNDAVGRAPIPDTAGQVSGTDPGGADTTTPPDIAGVPPASGGDPSKTPPSGDVAAPEDAPTTDAPVPDTAATPTPKISPKHEPRPVGAESHAARERRMSRIRKRPTGKSSDDTRGGRDSGAHASDRGPKNGGTAKVGNPPARKPPESHGSPTPTNPPLEGDIGK